MAKLKEDDPRRFLHPQTIARISRLDLRARHVVEGFISGMHRSPFFGHSVEFVQHREYVAGDDIRHLDWKVWSKTDRFYIKQYEEETNLRCTLVVDVSESMHYGRGAAEQVRLRLHRRRLPGLPAAAAAGLGRPASPSTRTCARSCRPRSQQTHIDAIVKAMHVSKPRREDRHREDPPPRRREQSPSRGMIVIVSDLLVDREPLFRGLEMLRHRRHDVLVFHVLDDDELTFPFAGTTRFEGMEELPHLLCDPRALRDGYLEALEEYLVEVRRGCARRGIDYTLVRTGDYLDAVLSKFLHHRMALKAAANVEGCILDAGFCNMLEFLFIPGTMIAGGVLVSSPIIIHLINRMRFKRVRWAAMEFLLKSQKRNRRRLIIEQLILLLLRILLVLLIALLVARFIGMVFGMQPQNRQHIILLDDTPSMTDQWKQDGETRVSFKEAKRLLVDEIAKNAVLASKAQQLKLIVLSRPGEVIFDQRLNDQTIKELGTALTQIEPSFVHVSLLKGIQQAKKLSDAAAPDQRVFYLVSDFRQIDWSGSSGKELTDALARMSEEGVHIKLIDVANPPRKETESDAGFHENLSIVRLEPWYRVVGRNMPPTPFTVTVANHGLADRQNVQVRVKLNGRDEAGSSVPIRSIPAGGQVDVVFHVFLDQVGINQISANIEPEEAGLQVDDVRYATIDVRDRVPILVVDGDPRRSKVEGGDFYHLNVIFGPGQPVIAPGYTLVVGTLADLERPDIEQYPSIYLINVRELNDKALANLESYARRGGSVAFFLGEQVNADFYNKRLYADGSGLFPAPLAATPTPELSEEEKLTRMLTDLTNHQEQVFIRQGKENHPVFSKLMEGLGPRQQYREVFKLCTVDRHWPVVRIKWNPELGQVEELLTLPNRRSIDDYKDGVQTLLAKLPVDDPQFARYRNALQDYRDRIRNVLTSNEPLYQLANLLDRLLHDEGDRDQRPNLTQMWQQDSLVRLRGEVERLRDTVKFGDPLLIVGKYGKGRVSVWTTTLGRRWTGWPLVGLTYVPIMDHLQKYLTGTSSDADLTVGTPLDIQLDANRYDTKMRRWFKPELAEAAAKEEGEAQARGLLDMGKQDGLTEKGKIRFSFADARKPGVYVLDFFPRSEGLVDPKPESVGYAFNIDARSEGDLRRAAADPLVRGIAGSERLDYVSFYSLGSTSFTDLKGQEADLSEGPWLFLAFLLILLAEQALAVHLSYHLRGNEAAPPALKTTTSVSV